MILSGRLRHSRLPAGLVVSRLLSCVFVASCFTGVGPFSELGVPLAEGDRSDGGFSTGRLPPRVSGGWLFLARLGPLREWFAERPAGWAVGRLTGFLGLLWARCSAFRGGSFVEVVDCACFALIVRVDEAWGFLYGADWLLWSSMDWIPVSVEVCVGQLDRVCAVEAFRFVVDRSSDVCGEFSHDHLFDDAIDSDVVACPNLRSWFSISLPIL